MQRNPDFYVLTESGYRSPCHLSGSFSASNPEILVADQGKSGTAFLIDYKQRCLVTWAGTRLDIAIEPAEPPTEFWLLLTEESDDLSDGLPDPTNRPEYPSLI